MVEIEGYHSIGGVPMETGVIHRGILKKNNRSKVNLAKYCLHTQITHTTINIE